MLKFPETFKKNDFNKLKNFSSNSSSGRPEYFCEKCAKWFRHRSEKFRSEAGNFHQTFFISENSSKDSPGYVKPSIDNRFEEILQGPKYSHWTSETDEIYYFYFNNIVFIKLFLWKRRIQFSKRLPEKIVSCP